MAQPTSPFAQGLMKIGTARKPAVRQAVPSLPAAPVSPQTNLPAKRYNPFLTALNTDSPEFKEIYGVNRPLAKPMLLGYRDDQPVYAGSRLFLLY